MEHHSLPDARSFILTPDHLGGIEFDLQLLWSAQTFDSPYQLWRATSSYNRWVRAGAGGDPKRSQSLSEAWDTWPCWRRRLLLAEVGFPL